MIDYTEEEATECLRLLDARKASDSLADNVRRAYRRKRWHDVVLYYKEWSMLYLREMYFTPDLGASLAKGVQS